MLTYFHPLVLTFLLLVTRVKGNWLAEHIVSSQEAVERENLELQSMVMMTLH